MTPAWAKKREEMLHAARERVDLLFGGVAASTRELLATELVIWWLRGGVYALQEETERKRAQASSTKVVTHESGPESYRQGK